MGATDAHLLTLQGPLQVHMKGIGKYFVFSKNILKNVTAMGLAREPDQASPFLSKPVLPT